LRSPASTVVTQVLTVQGRKCSKGYTHLLVDVHEINLKKYQADLKVVIEEYTRRLDHFLWRKLSQQERDRLVWPHLKILCLKGFYFGVLSLQEKRFFYILGMDHIFTIFRT